MLAPIYFRGVKKDPTESHVKHPIHSSNPGSQASQIHSASTDPNRSIVEKASHTYFLDGGSLENGEKKKEKVKNLVIPFLPTSFIENWEVLFQYKTCFVVTALADSFVHSALSPPNFFVW